MNVDDYQPPLVAILRGLKAAEAADVGRALFDAGFRLLEVPLNRPEALDCIVVLAALAPPGALVGGGTVLSAGDVDAVHAAGGRLVVAPNCAPEVIAHAVRRGMLCAPGVATPTEAFTALAHGAHALKLFPAQVVGPAGLKAMRSVLPPGVPLWPVGGITPQSLADWLHAGASGFGLGGQLFEPGMDARAVAASAAAFMHAWRVARRADV